MNLTTRSTSDPAPARPASTVVLLRDGPVGLELLVTTRPESMRFMGGAAVFPGGAVAAADRDERWEQNSRLSSAAAAEALGEADARAALGAFVCALREAFEEVGYLAGEGPLHEIRRADADDPARFLARCVEAGVVLATDELVPAGRWVTPPGAPVRFDARFFLTRVPEGWEPDPDPSEVAAAAWTTPAAALDDLGAGRAVMAPPTIEMLQRLARFDAVADALAAPPPSDDAPLSVRLSPLVHVVLAPNPGVMTGPGTNTYVVGTNPFVVVDPAVDDPVFLAAIESVTDGQIASVLVTHRHSDHVGGAAAVAAMSGAPIRAFGEARAGDAPVEPMGDGEVTLAGDARLIALHTPGHASDHLCFLLEGVSELLSGDTILGEGTAVIAPPDGDMRAYMQSLRRLAEIDIARIYPGHFRALDGGNDVVQSYIAHRRMRAEAILEALSGGPLSVSEIVAAVYVDTPPALHPIAEYSVRAHLEMAQEEGVVRRDDVGRWSRI